MAGTTTSVALFVGPTRSGVDNRPIRCLNYGDFERSFGGLWRTSSLSYSVLHFFANGGGQAYVVRVPPEKSKPAATTVLRDDGAQTSLVLTALSSGSASNGIFVEIDPFEIGANPYASGSPAHDKKRFTLTVLDTVSGRVERFGGLTTSAGSARTADAVVNDPATGSRLVRLQLTGVGENGPQATGTVHVITKPPGAVGTFDKDVMVTVGVSRRGADGKVDAAASITAMEVTVFPNGSSRPTSPLALVTQLVAAVNEAIRANPGEASKLGTASLEGAVFEGGRCLRLRLTAPTSVPGAARVHDATVALTAPTTAAARSLITEYGLGTGAVVNPSRYQLGQPYDAAPVSAATAGDNGEAHGQPTSAAFKAAVSALDTPDPFFNLLCLPDLVRPKTTDGRALHHTNVPTVYAEAARICARKFAFLVVDPPPDVLDVGAAEAWKTQTIGFQSSHAGAWFPTVRVDDPLEPGTVIAHPPSGAVAGVIARTDSQRGVWQAPAGTEAFLAGVYGPSVELSDEEHGLLNPIAVNVIRRFPIYGTVAFGSRTVDGSNALGSQWKYIPVRRTANFILRSLSESLRWAIHQPNGEALWSQLRVSCTAFMQGLFQQGAFKGVSAREAYFVACDASTTSAEDIDQGIVNIVVGFAPLKPSEFVVISLRQIVQPTA
ncbi:phage tail sheath family protein [Cellulomonas humilata]|uniref:Phage tail sheath family protein n=1 Tax=Cellulomonas humilata TaxID=144055 RepID=A0A7Y6DZX2_9CELL|nr:phage tail sheath family protein [Cellulomonas humilata]